jgi:protein-S-isoprenylcysteine O-methyltransferase Ste14
MHTRIEHWRKMGQRAYWIAGIGWPATIIPMVYFRDRVFGPSVYLSAGESMAMLALGTVTLIIAIALSFQAEKKMPLRTLVGLPELEPGKNRQPLLNSGIYAKTRNPIYLVHWLLLFSAAAITGFVSNWIVFLLDCIVLPLMIRVEERELLNRYGAEFADYMRRVPRFFPKWTW